MEDLQYLMLEYLHDKTTINNMAWKKSLITPKKLLFFTSLIFVIVLVLMIIGYMLHPALFNIENQYYLLSALFQGIAAIFAIGITAILIGLQFLDNKYSYQGIKYIPEYVLGFKWYIIIYLSYLIALLMLLLFVNKEYINSYYFLLLYFVISFGAFIIIYTWAKITNIIHSLDYQLFFHLLTNNIYILDTKSKFNIKYNTYTYLEKNYKEIMDMFSEIINKSLKSQNENIAIHGFAALTSIFSSQLITPAIFNEEKEKILNEIRYRYVRDAEIHINTAAKMGDYKFLYVMLGCILNIAIGATIYIKTKEDLMRNNISPLILYFPEIIINKIKIIDETLLINKYFIFTETIISLLSFLKTISHEHIKTNVSIGKMLIEIPNIDSIKPNYEVIDEIFVSFFKPLGNLIQDLKNEKDLKKKDLLINDFLIFQIIDMGKELAHIKKLKNSLNMIIDTLKNYISFLCQDNTYSKKGEDTIEIGLKNIFKICQKEKVEYCIKKKKEIINDLLKNIPSDSPCKFKLVNMI